MMPSLSTPLMTKNSIPSYKFCNIRVIICFPRSSFSIQTMKLVNIWIPNKRSIVGMPRGLNSYKHIYSWSNISQESKILLQMHIAKQKWLALNSSRNYIKMIQISTMFGSQLRINLFNTIINNKGKYSPVFWLLDLARRQIRHNWICWMTSLSSLG